MISNIVSSSEKITRPTKMDVSIENAMYNISQIKKLVGENISIMPVIKANAYGTNLNKRLDFLNNFDIVAVAIVDEGVELRKLGYKKEIFVLNQPYVDEIEKLIENDLIIGVSSDSFIDEIGKSSKNVKIHVEIGTGMGRTGIYPKRIEEYIQRIKKYSNIIIDGIYTHLSSADIDPEYTRKQLDSFDYAVEIAKEKVATIRYVHSQASTGILNFNEKKYNLVRPGLIMYGFYPDDTFKDKIDLKPVITKLYSKVPFLKTVPENFSIGYGRSYITKRETKVATIPIGYADGFRRCLSNNWSVYINGKRAPIIGNVCMDSFMADVTDIDVKNGDEVIIFDNENITLEEYAKASNGITYEMISTISQRVPRNFI